MVNTIEEAVTVLSQRCHRDLPVWMVDRGNAYGGKGGIWDPADSLTEFEAVAIARRYEEEARKRPPLTAG